jgi:hypothetical protein
MPKSIPEYVAEKTEQAVLDLLTAAQDVPEDRRAWKPFDQGRSALDQLSECALLNRYTANVIENHGWPADGFANYMADKAEIEKDWDTAVEALKASVPVLIAAIRAFPEDKLDTVTETSFGPMTLEKNLSYPWWNMSYHQGQITYIAMLK